jgi:hypothetical protein
MKKRLFKTARQRKSDSTLIRALKDMVAELDDTLKVAEADEELALEAVCEAEDSLAFADEELANAQTALDDAIAHIDNVTSPAWYEANGQLAAAQVELAKAEGKRPPRLNNAAMQYLGLWKPGNPASSHRRSLRVVA